MSGAGIREQLQKLFIKVRDGYFFTFPEPHELQVRTGHTLESRVRVSMGEGERWAQTFFTSLNGERPLGELITVVPADYQDHVLSVVVALWRENLLVSSEQPFAQGEALEGDWLRRLMGPRFPVRDFYEEALRDAAVLVLGAGVLGSRVAASLVQLGTGTVTVADSQAVTELDRMSAPLYVGAEVGEARRDALLRPLKQLSRASAVDAVEQPETEESEAWRELVQKHTMVIVAEDSYRPALLQRVNETAVAQGVRWSMLLLDGWDVYVGPTFFPGQTGCYACWEQQRKRLMAAPDSYERYVNALIRKTQEPLFHGSPQFADVAAGMLTSDLLNLLGILPQRVEMQSSLTLGRQLHFDMRTFEAKLTNLIKEPRCATCQPKQGGGAL
ncbi:ThiF family adenylyltransferase [Tumebacillus sp. ITR2]|uniref:ThiF family adenylyltransferase n=1 Tax=Tumebacillus amylolyticus TaxID=2801339 RepID=A0ABS1J9L3_9BACL|nr:ThiF family adenylyltransferase [Tumebacillus amylolyticus]MBL0386963.1 ThiF family adenylyltransferase [Tumebacillus amylolyticus]